MTKGSINNDKIAFQCVKLLLLMPFFFFLFKAIIETTIDASKETKDKIKKGLTQVDPIKYKGSKHITHPKAGGSDK